MNTRAKLISLILLILLLFSSFNFGQVQINAKVGHGFTDLSNIGIHYQIEQTQYGISIGIIPWSDENNISIIGDFKYHFTGISVLSERKPWFLRLGINYLQKENSKEDYYRIEKPIYLICRIGREINFSKKVGLSLDLGLNIRVSYFSKEESTEELCCQGMGTIYEEFPFIPCFSASLFYNFSFN